MLKLHVKQSARLCRIIAGGSDGIGRETVLELARRGAKVIIANRRQTSGERAAESIIGMIRENDNVIFY